MTLKIRIYLGALQGEDIYKDIIYLMLPIIEKKMDAITYNIPTIAGLNLKHKYTVSWTYSKTNRYFILTINYCVKINHIKLKKYMESLIKSMRYAQISDYYQKLSIKTYKEYEGLNEN